MYDPEEWRKYWEEQSRLKAEKRKQAIEKRKKTLQYNAAKPQSIIDLEKRVFLATKKRVTYDDRTANGLTNFVMDWLQVRGYYAARINIGGIYLPQKGAYRESGSTKGVADVIGCIRGRFCQFEIKAGKDRPRADQLEQQRLTVESGGCYVFIHNADEFVQIAQKIENHQIKIERNEND